MPGMNRGDNLEEIYAWIDEIPFSKPKKNIPREFSDGVLMAEVLKIHYPRFVDVHNYIPASNVAAKRENWNTLNRKVFSKIDMKLSKDVINQLANSQPGIIEKLLKDLRNKILLEDSSSMAGEDPTTKSEIYNENFIRSSEEKTEDRITQEDEKTRSCEVLDTAVVKTSSSHISVTKSTKNLIGKACGWLVGWIWPFNGTAKSIEEEISSSPSVTAGLKSLEKSCSITEQPIAVNEAEKEDEESSGISRIDFLQLRQEVEEKDLAISMLNRKVSCLESVMKLKDQKIGNLAAQISTSSTETAQNLRPRVIGSSISRLRSQTKTYKSVS